MSQIANKPTETRLYKRGNDNIELDAFIRNAESGFYDWLDTLDIKDEYRPLLISAYQDMIGRINTNPESFTAKLGGGFTNDAGITNSPKGFDAYGIVASYLGNTLRKMPVYVKPEVKSDKPKYKKGEAPLTSLMWKGIVGDDPKYFIELDPYNGGKRGTTNRDAQTINMLTKMSLNPENYWDFDSDEDKTYVQSLINKGIQDLRDGNPNNDWYTLQQLGLTNPDKYFYTGEKLETEVAKLEQNPPTLSDFESWMTANHPLYSGNLLTKLFTSVGNATEQEKNALLSKMHKLTDNDIKNWILLYITNPNNDFTKYPKLLNSIGGVLQNGKFTSDLIMTGVFGIAISRGLATQLSDGLYYFPFTYPKQDHQGGGRTVFVYDINTNTLKQVDAHNIPEYLNLYLQEYQQYNPQTTGAYQQYYPNMYPSNKQGGILKALLGTAIPYINNWAKFNYNVDFSDLITPTTTLPGWEAKTDNYRKDDIGKTSVNPTIQNSFDNLQNYIKSGSIPKDVTSVYNSWIQTNPNGTINDFLSKYNDTVIGARNKARNMWTDKSGNTTYGSLYDNFNWLYPSSAATYNPNSGFLGSQADLKNELGSTMFRRVPLTFENDQLYANYRSIQIGDNKIWMNNEGLLEIIDPNTGLPIRIEYPTTEPTIAENPTLPVKKSVFSILNEVNTRFKPLGTKANLSKQGFWSTLGTNLLGTGRLTGSILNNNNIANVVRQSLTPKLHDTYELFSPVTGAFSEMLLKNNQGSNIQFQANLPFTSDASLASARMLEGLKVASDLQLLGFIADDKEIQRTKGEALKRLENNIARRSVLSNQNRDEIQKNNLALAQLEASRLKMNWDSIDRYLAGIEKETKQRVAEDRNIRNQFNLQIGADEATAFRNLAMQLLYDQYAIYKQTHPNATYSDWILANLNSYTQAVKGINSYSRALLNKNFAETYGLNYQWPSYKNSLGIEAPLSWNIYNYQWLKNGGSIKR